MAKSSRLEEKYPNLDRFIHEIGWIEIGQSEMISSFVRAYDEGGTVYEGAKKYPTLEAALEDLDVGIQAHLEKYGI